MTDADSVLRSVLRRGEVAIGMLLLSLVAVGMSFLRLSSLLSSLELSDAKVCEP